jgi:hypothetical protein
MYPLETGNLRPRELTRELNQLLRRFRQYQTEAEWFSAVLDGAAHFMRQGALFACKDGAAVLRGQINLPLPDRFLLPISAAPAFAAAINSEDPLVVLTTSAEIGETLGAASAGQRAHVFPISNGERVVAVLFAAGTEPVDHDALELIAGMASVVLERKAKASLHTQIERHLGSSS